MNQDAAHPDFWFLASTTRSTTFETQGTTIN